MPLSPPLTPRLRPAALRALVAANTRPAPSKQQLRGELRVAELQIHHLRQHVAHLNTLLTC